MTNFPISIVIFFVFLLFFSSGCTEGIKKREKTASFFTEIGDGLNCYVLNELDATNDLFKDFNCYTCCYDCNSKPRIDTVVKGSELEELARELEKSKKDIRTVRDNNELLSDFDEKLKRLTDEVLEVLKKLGIKPPHGFKQKLENKVEEIMKRRVKDSIEEQHSSDSLGHQDQLNDNNSFIRGIWVSLISLVMSAASLILIAINRCQLNRHSGRGGELEKGSSEQGEQMSVLSTKTEQLDNVFEVVTRLENEMTNMRRDIDELRSELVLIKNLGEVRPNKGPSAQASYVSGKGVLKKEKKTPSPKSDLKIIHLGAPSSKELFPYNKVGLDDMAFVYYKMEVTTPNSSFAEFTIIDDAEKHIEMLSQENIYLHPVAEIEGSTRDAKRIKVIRKGKLEKKGHNWHVKERLKIKVS